MLTVLDFHSEERRGRVMDVIYIGLGLLLFGASVALVALLARL
jgi:hypothetical protein